MGSKNTYHKKGTFQPVGFAIAKEISNNKNRQDEQADHEDLKVEVQGLAHDPCNNNSQWGVEKGCLNGGAETVIQGNVDHAI
jgi:hypothetical protein